MLEIDLDAATPLTDQIIAGIRLELASSRLRAGDELPPVRQLAADLDVNFNTVARAYRALEASGLVSSKRGRGTRVVAGAEPPSRHDPESVARGLRAALVDARLGGWSADRLFDVIREEMHDLWTPDSEEIHR